MSRISALRSFAIGCASFAITGVTIAITATQGSALFG
jgi:hypothetical protein